VTKYVAGISLFFQSEEMVNHVVNLPEERKTCDGEMGRLDLFNSPKRVSRETCHTATNCERLDMKESRTWANIIDGCVSRVLLKVIILVVPSQPPFEDKSTLWPPRPHRSGHPSRPTRPSANLPGLTSVL
jgi:hypothetical protein